MKHRAVLVFAFLFAFGCDDSSPATGDDTGGGDMDAGPAETDAGGGGGDEDAGPASLCPPGVPMPEPWDCTTAEPITAGDPITAEALTWTWVGFENAVCMDGSSTGIGVSINPESDRLLIVLEGGGACFDPVSCAGVANQDGYGETKFTRDTTGVLSRGIFDRDDETNPFRDFSFVYVPYCTGDVHGGVNPEGPGGRLHLGHQREIFTTVVSL